MKNAKVERIMAGIITGRNPMIIEGVNGFCFVADYVSKYSVSGYVCGLIGDYESKFKQVKIQKTKDGKQYIMADRKQFWIDNIRPATLQREYIEKRLAEHMALQRTFIDIKESGSDVGYSIENQEFYIKNILKYIYDMDKHTFVD